MKRLAPTPEALELVRGTIPLRRLGTPAVIASCALFLSSPLAEYINGAVIPVDGGQSLSGAGVMSLELTRAMKQRGAEDQS